MLPDRQRTSRLQSVSYVAYIESARRRNKGPSKRAAPATLSPESSKDARLGYRREIGRVTPPFLSPKPCGEKTRKNGRGGKA